MTVRGFDRLASLMNERQLVLRGVFHLQAGDSISGDDLLSGSNLAGLRLQFDESDVYLICIGESDELEICEAPPSALWLSQDVSQDQPWKQALGGSLSNAWQLNNNMGYDDGICLNFRSATSSDARILVESIASRFSIFEIIPTKA